MISSLLKTTPGNGVLKFVVAACALLTGEQLLAQPKIKSFTPISGEIGTQVTISGSNFHTQADLNFVYFGAVRANVVSAADTQLVVIAPAGATHKPITVTAGGLTATASVPFIVTFKGGDLFLPNSFATRKDSALERAGNKPGMADFDGDGKVDLVLGGIRNLDDFGGMLQILRNTADDKGITFAPPVSIEVHQAPYNFTIEDMDADGKLDIVVVQTYAEGLMIYKNNSTVGQISFTALDWQHVGSPAGTYLGIHDLDGDGRLDIVADYDYYSLEYGVKCLMNTSVGGVLSFRDTSYALAAVAGNLSVADFNNDGLPDIGYTDMTNKRFYILKNTSATGQLSFAAKLNIADAATFVVGDLNRDLKPDIVTNFVFPHAYLRNTSTNSTLSFAAPVYFAKAGVVSALVDFNGDGLPEFLFSDTARDVVVTIRNAGKTNTVPLGEKREWPTGDSPTYILAGDLNNDGKSDILTTNFSGSLTILENKVAEPLLVPSGTDPVAGEIIFKETVDSLVNSYNGHPYVQRHYDIEPLRNAATSTASVALYFLQRDFDNFNLTVSEPDRLPTSASDIIGKANLRIYQYHGTSSSSEPGTYSGQAIEINPHDSSIVWDSLFQVWKISFDIHGFSGFYVGSAGSSLLPLRLLSFSASRTGAYPVLKWITSQELNTSQFELMRSVDGSSFKTVALIKSKPNSIIGNYQYTDTVHSGGIYYYKLRMSDVDGNYTYSRIISVATENLHAALTVLPNPATDFAVLRHPLSRNHAAVHIIDMAGRTIRNYKISKGNVETVLDLKRLPKGTYKLVWSDGISKELETLIVL